MKWQMSFSLSAAVYLTKHFHNIVPVGALTATHPCLQTSKHCFSSSRWNQRPWHGRAHHQRTTVSVHAPSHRSLTSVDDGQSDFYSKSTFEGIGIKSEVLLDRLKNLNFIHPTLVQEASYQKISQGNLPVIIGAETGSGKTLAYLLPIIDAILHQKSKSENGMPDYDYAKCIILVPNKELVRQVLRMAVPLCGGSRNVVWGKNMVPDDNSAEVSSAADNVRIAVMPGGLSSPRDFKPFRESIGLGGSELPVDILVSTPASIGPLALKPKNIDMFADIETLVVDEADMLLDGGYIRQLENTLLGFRRADRLDASMGSKKTKYIFSAATLPDMGLRSVDAYLRKKFPYAERVNMKTMHYARHYGLAEPTVWIKEETKKVRMEKLIDLLGRDAAQGGLQGDKVMVFVNTAEDADGAHEALQRAGVQSTLYHAKIPLEDRISNLESFRRSGDGSTVLVCTDLASRGLDVSGVTAVVQLQFAGNVVAHLHRMGRCGRAGMKNGKGIVFFNEKESSLVSVVKDAEMQQDRLGLESDVEEIDVEGELQPATVKRAFSRKRGFTKKLKKQGRDQL